jgi:hypothetical protein
MCLCMYAAHSFQWENAFIVEEKSIENSELFCGVVAVVAIHCCMGGLETKQVYLCVCVDMYV